MRQIQTSARALRACAFVLAVAASPALASAQKAPPPAPAARSVMYSATPVGARPTTPRPATDSAAATTAAVHMERHVGAGKNAALMVVGAAAIVTGAVVGGGTGAAIAIGGAALGLYGLYNFVK